MMSKPEAEHAWLQQLVGDWTWEHEAKMAPDQPAEKFTGTEHVRSVGGLWIIGEGRGPMPGGGEAVMIISLGYDPKKGRFVGTWLGSMMSNLWVYEGWLDEARTTLTLETEGPSFADPAKTGKFRETIQILSSDHRTFASSMQNDDGGWTTFMTAHYRRAK